VLGGARLAIDQGEYLEGVNAVAAAVPGGLVWVAGFAARLTSDRLDEVAALLGRLCAERSSET
jgi:DNA-binding IclR family transcriptional regulator